MHLFFFVGATGFVGGRMVFDILSNARQYGFENICLVLLVRGKNNLDARLIILSLWTQYSFQCPVSQKFSAKGFSRYLTKNLKFIWCYALDAQQLVSQAVASGRLVVLAGSLETRHFGLSESDFFAFSSRTISIIHVGAAVLKLFIFYFTKKYTRSITHWTMRHWSAKTLIPSRIFCKWVWSHQIMEIN